MNRAQRRTEYLARRPAVRAAVFQRDRGRCRACGVGVRLHGHPRVVANMHELVPRSLGGSPLDSKNVITLCPQCHRDTSMRVGGKRLLMTSVSDKGADGIIVVIFLRHARV